VGVGVFLDIRKTAMLVYMTSGNKTFDFVHVPFQFSLVVHLSRGQKQLQGDLNMKEGRKEGRRVANKGK
jgi:hypothetical protein